MTGILDNGEMDLAGIDRERERKLLLYQLSSRGDGGMKQPEIADCG